MFTRKNLLLLIGRNALIALGVVAISFTAIVFLSKEIERVSDNVVKNRNLANMLEKRTTLFSLLKKDALIVGNGDTIITNAFIPSNNILEFIASLESIALKNGVTQSFRFESPTSSSLEAPFPIATIGYSNSLNANVLTFSNYLKDFERLPYFTKIENITITSQDKTGWQSASTASFRASLYTKSSE
jgi:hypothetical protein